MATAAMYIQANGLRVYYEVYGEGDVLGRPGVSKELGRFNSAFHGLGEREIERAHRHRQRSRW